MKICTVPTSNPDREIQYWYERTWRSWAVALFDAKGNQLGDTTYVYTKREVLRVVDDLVGQEG